jgi:hypothetical protein
MSKKPDSPTVLTDILMRIVGEDWRIEVSEMRFCKWVEDKLHCDN